MVPYSVEMSKNGNISEAQPKMSGGYVTLSVLNLVKN